MTHGNCVPPQLAYAPWAMGYSYSCTIHGPCKIHTIQTVVQPMDHGYHIVLYSSWSMGDMCYVDCCTTHGPWILCSAVQPMVHGKCVLYRLLYNPWAMGYSYSCAIHGPWEIHAI